MKALIATRIFAPEPAAASFRLRALAREIAARGGRVRVVTTSAPASLTPTSVAPTSAISPGVTAGAAAPGSGAESHIDVRRMPVLRDKEGYVRGYVQYMSFDIPLFFRLLTAKKPDVIICEPPPTTGFVTRIAAGIRRIPYVYYAADIWSDAAAASAPRPIVKVLRCVEMWALKGATEVLTVSDVLAERLKRMGVEHITVATNGIDTDIFTAEKAPTEGRPLEDTEDVPAEDAPTADEEDAEDASARPRPGERYFVYAGTASEWQGAEIFAQAMKIVHQSEPDVKLYYLGQGNSTGKISAIADSLPQGTVVQIGRVDQAEAAAWQRYAAGALVSIKPGMGYDFAIPTKAYAALSTGTPVIYAGPGPLREAIINENLGETVDYDPEAVARAMLSMLYTPKTPSESRRLHQWVVDHHSLLTTARAACNGVEKALARWRQLQAA